MGLDQSCPNLRERGAICRLIKFAELSFSFFIAIQYLNPVSAKISVIPADPHETFIRRQKIASRVTIPNSMLGFARGLATVAKEDEKSAALLGGILSFMNRYPKGEVVFTSMEEGTVESLMKAAEATDLLDDADEHDSPPPPTPRPTLGGIIFGD